VHTPVATFPMHAAEEHKGDLEASVHATALSAAPSGEHTGCLHAALALTTARALTTALAARAA
jgi:hypothetical protein